MPEFTFDDPPIKFRVPERLTVRQQLAYRSVAALNADLPMVEQWWLAALELIEGWECTTFPDPRVPLDEVTNPTITEIVQWAGSQVRIYVSSLEDIDPN